MIVPLRWLFRVLGLLPNNTKYDIYFSSVATFIPLASLYVSLAGTWWMFRTWPDVVIDVTDNTVFTLIGVLYVVKIYLNRKEFITFVNESLLPKESDDVKCETSLFFAFSIFLSARAISRYIVSQLFIRSLLFDAAMGIAYGPSIMHILMVNQLRGRFSILNDQLRDLSVSTAGFGPPRNLRARLTTVFRAHVHLRGLQAKINSHFGIFNLSMISCQTIFSTWSLYILILDMVNVYKNVNILNVIVFISAITDLIAVCDTCYRCSEEVI